VSDQHDPEQLAAYAVGLLDDADARAVAAHTARCSQCQRELTELREVSAALCATSPELFLDGSPEDGELVLQRTLRQVRQESSARLGRRRRALVAAAVAALVIGAGAAEVSLGRITGGQPSVAAGSRMLTGDNPATGAHLTVAITPKDGFVRVTATTRGIAAGEHCVLLVVDRDGHQHFASSWTAPWGADTGVAYTNESAVNVAAADITTVELHNATGSDLVNARA
jgi:hypothetical protein